MPTYSFPRNAIFGDDWALVGLAGLAAALPRDAGTKLDSEALVRAAKALSLESGWFGCTTREVPADVLDRLHLGLARSLVGHGKHRVFAPGGSDRLAGIVHSTLAADWLTTKKPVKLTRSILPNWIDDGSRFPVQQVFPLLFAPLASVFLPLASSGAVIVAPIVLDSTAARDVVAEIVPAAIEEAVPANAADAALNMILRLRHFGLLRHVSGVSAWTFGWSSANKRFREIKSIDRFVVPADESLAKWERFSAETPPSAGPHGWFADRVRGLAAHNLLSGRRLYDGFAGLCGDSAAFGYLRRGSRALLRVLA